MFKKQIEMFKSTKDRVNKTISNRFWGNEPAVDRFLLFNRMFGSMFPGQSPKGLAHNRRSSSTMIKYRQKRKKLNRASFESRRKNWRK